jgi:2-hydroxycyclohexanecarboxyl-CoA dehydrogenase
MTLEGRTAIVTGAAGGIGTAISTHLANAGASVALCDLNGDAAHALAGQLPGKCAGFAMDVSDSAGVAATVAAVEADLGPVDILVNNAGIDIIERFIESTEDTWQKIVSVNYLGTVIVTRAVLDGMIERRYGRIINIGSDAGRVGSSMEAVYSGAKGGIIAFTKTLAREVATKGVTANTVCPGPTDTPALRKFADGAGGGDAEKVISGMTRAVPMKRLGTPEDIGPAVSFFASDGAGFVTGQTLSVSGGLTMA